MMQMSTNIKINTKFWELAEALVIKHQIIDPTKMIARTVEVATKILTKIETGTTNTTQKMATRIAADRTDYQMTNLSS